MTIPLVLVAAIARNRVIGGNNQLLWRLPSDLKQFRARTWGKPLIMGRRTFASIGKPLPGRETIVVTRDASFVRDGVLVAHSTDAALTLARQRAAAMGAAEVVLAGGGELYAAMMGQAERLYLTEVDLEPDGDVFFPAIDPGEWLEIRRDEPSRDPRDQTSFRFIDYQRRGTTVD